MAARKNPDLLVVAAHLPELSGLRRRLGDGLRSDVAGIDVSAEAVGIGLPAAASGMAARFERSRPRAVILIGTCGAYDGCGLEIGQVVVGRRVRLVSAAVAAEKGVFPEPLSTVFDTDAALFERLCGAGMSAVDVATTLAITIDGGSRRRCAAAKAARSSTSRRSPWSNAPPRTRAVRDRARGREPCGAGAREQWRANQRRAGVGAAAHVVAWLERGAPGLRGSPR